MAIDLIEIDLMMPGMWAVIVAKIMMFTVFDEINGRIELRSKKMVTASKPADLDANALRRRSFAGTMRQMLL
jgi:hypothetical protein